MKTMIALRRVSTPATPIVNSTAEKNRASASIGRRPASAEHDGADDRGEEQDAGDLEGEQGLMKQWAGNRRDDPAQLDLPLQVTGGQLRLDVRAGEREDLRQQ